MNQRRAFTRIELLVVIIIIAVITSMMVPAYSQFLQKARFDGVSREVQDVFAYARERAIAYDTTVTVSYDPQSETFSVQVVSPPPPTDQPTALLTGPNGQAITDSGPGSPRMLQLDPAYTIANFSTGAQASQSGNGARSRQGNSPEIHFKGDGTCDGASFILASIEGRSAHFLLMPATGRLIVENDTAQNQ